jgi:hypothetical protein
MPYQSSFLDFSAGPVHTHEIVQYRPNREALWIMTYAGGDIFQDSRGFASMGSGIRLTGNIPYRISRQLDGEMVVGPWFADGTVLHATIWESWPNDTIMTPSAQDIVAKGEIAIPHDAIAAVLDRFKRGK